MTNVLVLSYAACSTCKKALKWLDAKGVKYTVRPIVEEPPTASELTSWVPKSHKGIRKWLNTSGQSYRAMGKAKVDAASDAQVQAWLTEDGKLVKRPVIVVSTGQREKAVIVGFDEAALEAQLGA